MIRAVLDANVVLAGVLRYGSPGNTPGEVLHRWSAGEFELITSDAIVAEIERVLFTHRYFAARVTRAVGVEWISALNEFAASARLTVAVAGVASHAADDLVLAAAVSAAAEYLVTGDKELLQLGRFRGVAIVSPRAFLDALHTPPGKTETQAADRPPGAG